MIAKLRSILTILIFLCSALSSFSEATHGNEPPASIKRETYLSCLTGSLTVSGSQNWYNIMLQIANNCGVAVDMQNSTITFMGTHDLNTNAWGNFGSLSYPDNNLPITSSLVSAGVYQSSLPLHFPVASWANSVLGSGASFTIIFGAPWSNFDPGSVKVYVSSSPTQVGSITLINSTARPADVTQTSATILIMSDSSSQNVLVPWQGQTVVSNLAPANYSIAPVAITTSQGNTYQGAATPNIVTVVANQNVSSTISYSLVSKLGKVNIVVPARPAALTNYQGTPTITLREDTGTSLSYTLPWGTTSTIDNLDENHSFLLTTPPITFNGTTCSGSFNPTSLISSTTTPPSSHLSYVCSANQARMIAYVPGWKTPPTAATLAQAGYTHVSIAFGVFSVSEPGQIVNAFSTVDKAYIDSLHQLGLKVLLSLGGASTSISGTSVDFHYVLSLASSVSAFQTTFVNSVKAFASQFGFDGVDIDIEHGLVGSGSFSAPTGDIAVLASILNTLHQDLPSFLISLAPQVANISATSGFDGVWGNYASLIMQTHSALSFVGIQIYNTGCAYGIDHVCYGDNATSPDLSVAMATDLLENWPATDSSGNATGFQPYKSYLTGNQIVLGYPVPNSLGQSDGSPVKPTSVIKRALQCLRTGAKSATSCDTYVPPRQYQIGGVFGWEATYDQDNSFRFATDLSPCIAKGNC